MTDEEQPAPPELTLQRYVDDDGVTIVRNTLGLTAYLAEPDQWARGAAARALESFLARVPQQYLKHYTTTLMNRWRKLEGNALQDLLDGARIDGMSGECRHLFGMRVVNDYGCPSLGFGYTEIDPRRAERSGVIEMTLPQSMDPAELFQLALELTHLGPLHSLVAGFAVRWNERKEALAFQQIYRWCARYVGLDIQKEHELSWRTPTELPGTNWLTFIGSPLADARGIDLDELEGRTFTHGSQTIQSDAGLLLRAGEWPTMGDLNRLSYPDAYAEVSHALWDSVVAEPPPLWGPFFKHGHTLPWYQRFIDPEAWVDRKKDFFKAQAQPKPA